MTLNVIFVVLRLIFCCTFASLHQNQTDFRPDLLQPRKWIWFSDGKLKRVECTSFVSTPCQRKITRFGWIYKRIIVILNRCLGNLIMVTYVPGSKAVVLKLISEDSVQKTLANQTKSAAPSLSTHWTTATIPSVMMGFKTGNEFFSNNSFCSFSKVLIPPALILRCMSQHFCFVPSNNNYICFL